MSKKIPKTKRIIPGDDHDNPIHIFYNEDMNDEPNVIKNVTGTYSVDLYNSSKNPTFSKEQIKKQKEFKKQQKEFEKQKMDFYKTLVRKSNMSRKMSPKGGRRRKTAKKSRNSKR